MDVEFMLSDSLEVRFMIFHMPSAYLLPLQYRLSGPN